MSPTEASDRSSTSGEALHFASQNGRRPRARSLKQLAAFFLIFSVMAGISWLMLSWLATLHDKELLFTETTINTVLLVAVLAALVVIVPAVVLMVRSTREKVKNGEGILSTASEYLDSNTRNPLLTREDFKTGFFGKLLNIVSKSDPPPPVQISEPVEPAEEPGMVAQTHEEASRRIKEFNSEMKDLFPRWKQRIGAYEQRVEELEKELSARDSENSELLKRQIELVNQHLNLAREKAEDDDTEFETRPTASPTASRDQTGNLMEFVSPKESESTAPERAAELTRRFRHDTESLSQEDKIKVYEERIAAMEAEQAGTEAENKELTWNQLHLMQEKLAKLTGAPSPSTDPSPTETSNGDGSATPKQVAGFKTEIRRRAALRVAELNERLARMYPNSGDRIAAYEERLARIENELSERNSENKELLQCQMEMTKNYFRLMQGVPELGQGAPPGNDTLSQMFGLQFDLNSNQQEAARQVAAFNQKLNNNNTSNDDHVEAYKKRVAELEAEVARKDQENRELYEAQLELVRYQLEHLEQTNICDEPMGYAEPVSRLDENGSPHVRIPQYRKVAIKEEIPREIRVLLDRKPTALKIQGLGRSKRHRASN